MHNSATQRIPFWEDDFPSNLLAGLKEDADPKHHIWIKNDLKKLRPNLKNLNSVPDPPKTGSNWSSTGSNLETLNTKFQVEPTICLNHVSNLASVDIILSESFFKLACHYNLPRRGWFIWFTVPYCTVPFSLIIVDLY